MITSKPKDGEGIIQRLTDTIGEKYIAARGLLTFFDDVTKTLSGIGWYVQRVTPADGETIVIGDSVHDTLLVIEGAGPLAALTLELPSGKDAWLGQTIRVASRIDVTALSYSTPVYGGPTTILTGEAFSIQEIGDAEWINV